MFLVATEPNIAPIQDLITTWIHIGQALVGSVGALAFIFAFIWKITAVESKSAWPRNSGFSGSLWGRSESRWPALWSAS